ncbi:MAG: V-type ATP synthase subunit E [Clostridiales bacterium]|nr:V-type ATP synthase subunit E [Clostridiales bacterium]
MASRLDIFLKNITDTADKKCSNLDSQTNARFEKSVSDYRKQASRQYWKKTNAEKNRIASRVNNQITSYEAEKQTSVLKIKNDYVDDIFAELKEKILAFTKTSDYSAFLEKSALGLKSIVGDNAEYYLRPEDMHYAPELEKALGKASFSEDANIKLGGLAATDAKGLIRADDTLDCRIREERSHFHELVDFDNI